MIVQAPPLPPVTEETPAVVQMGIIYGLIDPRYGIVRYVGKTERPLDERFKAHFYTSKVQDRSHRGNWILALKRLGVQPFPITLATVPLDSLNAAEIHHIAVCREECAYLGHPLTNGRDGGEGGALSAEARRKISLAITGRKHPHKGYVASPETRAKMSAAQLGKHKWPNGMPKHVVAAAAAWHRGHPLPLQVKEKISASLTGKHWTEEQCERVRGRKFTPEHRAKIAAALKGKPKSEEHCRRLSEVQRGKHLSEEHKAKLRGHGSWNTGKKLDNEAIRAKISAAQKKRYQDPAQREIMRTIQRELAAKRRAERDRLEVAS